MATYTDRRASATTAARRTGLRVGRECERTPDPQWQRELDRIAPPADTVSNLRILWEPGDFWRPRERWVIWQVYPMDRHGQAMLPWYVPKDALDGPSPRSTGHACVAGLCLCPMKANRWVDGPDSAFGVDVWQWRLWQQTGRFWKRFWIVQGHDGGHPYTYDEFERKYRKMNGEDPDPPSIGELPYAEPDSRTWNRIATLNLLRTHRAMGDFTNRTAADLHRERRDKSDAYEATKLEWLGSRIGEAAPRFQKALKRAGLGEVKPWERSGGFDVDEAREQAILEGDARPLSV